MCSTVRCHGVCSFEMQLKVDLSEHWCDSFMEFAFVVRYLPGNFCHILRFRRYVLHSLRSSITCRVASDEDRSRDFGSTYAFRLIAEGLAVCPFSGGFYTTYTVLPLPGFEVTHPIFNDVANTVARCFTPIIAKGYFSLTNVFQKREI